MTYKIAIILIGTILSSTAVPGQERPSKQDLIRTMSEGRFAEAYQGLELQHLKYPKDPDYIYYTGVCRVELSWRIPEAISLLTEAAKFKKESWFYLGRAHMLQYEFAEAEEAFSRFNDKASRDEKDKVQLSVYLAMCRNAQELCSQGKNLKVVKIDTIPESNLLIFLNKLRINGQLEKIEEPSMFSSKVREGIKFHVSGENWVFQSKYPLGKKHKDIFFSHADNIELNKFRTIGNPVNSPYDEDFVFYDETAPAIYFSSQGHSSAGGYDIFRSYYDKTTRKWSKPEQLGFPVNTPFDELAYVTIPGTSRSILVSRRNSAPGKLVAYTLENVDESPAEQISVSHAKAIGRLKVGQQNFDSNTKSTIVKAKSSPVNSFEAPPEIRNEASYQRMIHEALNLQIRSDSLKRLSDERKERLVVSKSESEKTRLWQEIKTLDARAEEIQVKADVLYRKAREVEAEKQGKNKSPDMNASVLAKKSFSNKDTGDQKQVSNATDKNTHSSIKNKKASEEDYDIKYRIQVGVFSKPQPEEFFKGFAPLLKENVSNTTVIKYYVGLYDKVAEAEKGLVKVKGAGFKDAYIIGFYNGKVIPLSRARELELSIRN